MRVGISRFNLVIERLFISGQDGLRLGKRITYRVSISLSSGFSFQVDACKDRAKLFTVSISLSSGFSFQVRDRVLFLPPVVVSISLSRGFSFQVLRKHLSEFRRDIIVSISLSRGFSFQVTAGLTHRVHMWHVSISLSRGFSFQESNERGLQDVHQVSISLSRGFSFQARSNELGPRQHRFGFNLVIERLFISGISLSV